jgi:hypothetical protein
LILLHLPSSLLSRKWTRFLVFSKGNKRGELLDQFLPVLIQFGGHVAQLSFYLVVVELTGFEKTVSELVEKFSLLVVVSFAEGPLNHA